MQVSTLRSIIILLIAVLLGSCSISEHVVQDGPFQKRKYFKRGWFFDPPKRSGTEEFAIEQIEKQEVEAVRDPYLDVLASDHLMPEQLSDVSLQELDLSAASILPEVSDLDHAALETDRSIPPGPGSLLLPAPEYASMAAVMTTGFAFLLPVALLFALVALIGRIGLLNNSGPRAEFIALLMGMAGLAALAAI